MIRNPPVQYFTKTKFFIIFILFIILGYLPKAVAYKAGFSQIDITPPLGEILPLVEGGSAPIKSIGDPLFVSSLVLDDSDHRIAIISLDVIDLRKEDFVYLKQALEKRGFAHSIISVTHTHGGIFTASMLDEVRVRVLESIDTAGKNLTPVKIGATSISVDEAYNRRLVFNEKITMVWQNTERMLTSPVDLSLGLIQLRDLEDKPFVTLFNYSAHPVITMDLQRAIVSADYPGYLREHFQKLSGGKSIFFIGASGDVNPYHANTQPLREAIARANEMGEKLAREAYKAQTQIQHFYTKGKFRFDRLTLSALSAEINLLLLTPDISLSGFPGEYFDALGKQFKREVKTPYTFFIGKSGGDLRYVPTVKDIDRGGFGADVNKLRVKQGDGEAHIQEAVSRLNALMKRE